MIPKIIHYCWFGHNSIPDWNLKCIQSWKKYCPDFQIKRWDESNYDVNSIPYTAEAYKKQRWAFVTDYARLDIVYREGGIYLDTDVEVLRNLEPLIAHAAFAGMEFADGVQYSVATGLGFGSEAGHPVVGRLRTMYHTMHFLNKDGNENTLTTPAWTTECLEKLGFQQKNCVQDIHGMIVYPTEYFAPKEYQTGKVRITKNTYSIHHYNGSWQSKAERDGMEQRRKYIRILGPTVGELALVTCQKFRRQGLCKTVSDGVLHIIKR